MSRQDDRNRFRKLPRGCRQRHPATKGGARRHTGGRRRPHRLVPGRSGDIRIQAEQANIHVIGDAAIAGAMPTLGLRGEFAGAICAAAIAALLAGEKPRPRRRSASCYSLIAPDYAISRRAPTARSDDQFSKPRAAGEISPLERRARHGARRGARAAERLVPHITGEVFG